MSKDLERSFIRTEIQQTVKNGKIAKCYFERETQTFKHESLILAQDERWRRA